MNPNPMNPRDPAGPANPGSTPEPGSGSPPGPGTAPEPGTAPPPPPVPGPPSARPQQNLFDWIRSQGVYRGRDRWVGGVASGIAHRMGIDPLIVRGIFIVLTLFAGIGVLLYGLAWAFLPEPDGRIHVQEVGAGRWSAGMTGALVTTVIGLPGLGRGFWGWGWDGAPGLFWALFWIGGIAYLIYYLVQRNKNRSGVQPMNTQQFAATAPADAPYYGAASQPVPGQASDARDTGAPGYPTAPGPPYGPGYAYGPGYPSGPVPPSGGYGGGYGAPGRPPKPRKIGPGTATVAVSAGAALLTGGTIKALDAGNVISLGDAANAVVWASAAAVLGLGILISGLRGRTSGLLGFLAAVALIIGGIFNVVPHGDRFAFHNEDWTPSSVEQASSGFDITGGRGTVDLRSLGLVAPLASDVVVPLNITASNVTVRIPDNVPVEVQAEMAFGNLNQGRENRNGPVDHVNRNYNTDKPGARLIVRIDGAISNINIQEGN